MAYRKNVRGRKPVKRRMNTGGRTSCPPGQHMMPDGTCMQGAYHGAPGTPGYRKGGNTRRYAHGGGTGGRTNCNPGEVELWGVCYDPATTSRISRNNEGLTGSIPNEIGWLQNLQVIDLRNNNLTGPIPSSIANLPYLYMLVMQHNNFTGSIPSNLFNLNGLNYNAPVPDNLTDASIEVQGYQEGEVIINLSHNQLTGQIPDMRPGLKGSIGLHWNQLTGVIPSSIGNTNLHYLNLSYNYGIGGLIPESICNLPLEDAGFQFNKFCPPYPSCVQDYVVSPGTLDNQDHSDCASYNLSHGDVNQDGFVDVQDIIQTLQHIMGNTQLSNVGQYYADVNQDGQLNITDVVAMIQNIMAQGNVTSRQQSQLQNLLRRARRAPRTRRNASPARMRRGGTTRRTTMRRGGRTKPKRRRMATGGRSGVSITRKSSNKRMNRKRDNSGTGFSK